MADPITIEWGILATEIVKTAMVGGGSAMLTALFLRKRTPPQPVQVAPGRCNSHVYLEYGLLNIRRKQEYQKTLLVQLCTKQGCQIPPEPAEIAVPQGLHGSPQGDAM